MDLIQTIYIFLIYSVTKLKRAMTLECDIKSLVYNLVLMSGIKIIIQCVRFKTSRIPSQYYQMNTLNFI